jgi:hypothetical protein
VAEFRRTFEALDLTFDDHLHRHCSEVLARPYNAFSEIRRDKWKSSPDAPRIERVLPEVAEVATRMGYQP